MADEDQGSVPLSIEKIDQHNKLLGDTDKLQLTDTVLTRAKHFLNDEEDGNINASSKKSPPRGNSVWGKGLMSRKKPSNVVESGQQDSSSKIGAEKNTASGNSHLQDHGTKQVLATFGPFLENLSSKKSTVQGK